MLAENTRDKYRKYRKNTKCDKIPDLEKKGSQEGPRNVPKYRKNTKCNKIPDLQRKEAKKGPEMSAKITKVTRICHVA